MSTDAGGTQGERDRGRKSGALGFLRDLAIILVVAIVISFVVKTFLVRSFYIPSGSMEQTLQIDDRILVNQLVPGVMELKRGDIVVFADPGGWLPASAAQDERSPLAAAGEFVLSLVGLATSESEEHLIKRVIGLPGDHVECCNALGQIIVNGTPIDEPYIVVPPGRSKASEPDFDVTVPDDAIWVLGDNRYNSQDSRYHQDDPGQGFVPLDDVVGRAFVISWPAARWGGLGGGEEAFTGVPDAPSDAR